MIFSFFSSYPEGIFVRKIASLFPVRNTVFSTTSRDKQFSLDFAGWDYFVRVKISAWQNLYLDWLSNAPPSSLHILHFEDLVADTEGSVRAVVAFLGMPSVDPERVSCAVRHAEGKFHRSSGSSSGSSSSGSSGSSSSGSRMVTANGAADIDPFTTDQRKLIEEAIDRVDAALRATGMKPLPKHKYQFL